MGNDLSVSTTLFAKNVTFAESEIDALVSRARNWRNFAVAGWILAGVGVVGASALARIHEVVPVVVHQDNLTGSTEVRTGRERLNMTDPANERQMIADLVRYTKVREGFTRAEADNNYQTAVAMSDPSMRGEIDNEFLSERNNDALVNKLTVRDRIQLDNISVSFLPATPGGKTRLAQVRYDRIKHIGAGEPTTQRFINTYSFTYDPAAIPNTVEGIALNFDGIQILNRRRDKESEETPLAKVAAPTNVYPAAPSASVGMAPVSFPSAVTK